MEEALKYWCDLNLEYKANEANEQIEEFKFLANKNNIQLIKNIKEYLYFGNINNEVLYYIFKLTDDIFIVQHVIKYKGYIFYNDIRCKNMVDVIYALMRFNYIKINNMMKNMHRYIYRVNNNIEPDLIFEHSLEYDKDKVIKYLLKSQEIDKIISNYSGDIKYMNSLLDSYI